MNLAANVPGWTRYWVAEEKLKQMVAAKGESKPPRIDTQLARQQAARAAPRCGGAGAAVPEVPGVEQGTAQAVVDLQEGVRRDQGHGGTQFRPHEGSSIAATRAWSPMADAPPWPCHCGARHVGDVAVRDGLAQKGGPAAHRVAPTIVAEPASQALLPIEVGPTASLPANSFVRVRGLPLSVSLTDGHAIGRVRGAIPLFGLPMLKANVPAGVSGRTEIVISLVRIDGALLTETRTVSGRAGSNGSPGRRRPSSPRRRAWASSRLPRRYRPAGWIAGRSRFAGGEGARRAPAGARGGSFFVGGNVAAARDFFERAAEAGLAAAALRLAASYDPAELQNLQVQGVVSDRALARKWYERARELGAPEAVERLARLGGS